MVMYVFKLILCNQITDLIFVVNVSVVEHYDKSTNKPIMIWLHGVSRKIESWLAMISLTELKCIYHMMI